jgi:hypothetical protein
VFITIRLTKLVLVIDVPVVPVAEQIRNAYLTRFTSDWLLQLDCDERLPATWRTTVEPILAAEIDTDVAAYYLPFRHFALNTPLNHGMGTNPSVRLFRRGRVRYHEDQAAHRNPILDGSLQSLVGRVPPVDHYTTRTIDQFIEKCIRYAKTESKELGPDDLDALATIKWFYRFAVVDEGWKDGFPGIAMATAVAFSRGLAHLYAWERLGGDEHPMRWRAKPVTTKAAFRRMLAEAKDASVVERFQVSSATASTKDRVAKALSDDPAAMFRWSNARYAAYHLRQRLRGGQA